MILANLQFAPKDTLDEYLLRFGLLQNYDDSTREVSTAKIVNAKRSWTRKCSL